MQDLDWTLLKSFVAVGEHGSLSAAARALKTSQATISRHIASLEKHFDTRLIERAKGGATLTPKGEKVMAFARNMAESASSLSMVMEGSDDLTGYVRITASHTIAHNVLPDILSQLRVEEPTIDIELLVNDKSDNLLWREADIAVRMYQPTQLDVITRKICVSPFGIFAAKSYLNRCDEITSLEEFERHDLIGLKESTRLVDDANAMGIPLAQHHFNFRCDDYAVIWQFIRAGFGIGVTQSKIAAKDPDVVQLFETMDLGAIPIWLTTHSDIHDNPRIRRVYDHLAKGISAYFA